MSEKDAEILSFLEDITITDLEDEDGEDTGYSLTFTFKENEYFSNESLSISLDVSLDSGIMQVDRLEGTHILWKSDAKNPTIKVMKKKKQGQTKKPPVVKREKVESFFNIFSPPNLEETAEMEGEEAEEIQGEIEQLLAVCELLRDEIIPNAVDWFTGAALEGEDDEDDEYDDEDDDEEEEEEEDEDYDDEDGEAPLQPVDAKDAAECKQQ
jgi:nucleosome assembly protein 1-like 1